jgi:hypothetical protein
MGSRCCKINSASSGLRIRFTSMPIRIPLFPLMPIRIPLFNSMRIRILLLIKGMLICDHWSTDLPWAPFWVSTPPLLASPTLYGSIFEPLKLLNFDLCGSGSSFSLKCWLSPKNNPDRNPASRFAIFIIGIRYFPFWLRYFHKYIRPQSRQSVKQSSELGLHQPLTRRQVCSPPPPVLGGGAHLLAREGLGESQFRRGEFPEFREILLKKIPLNSEEFRMFFKKFRIPPEVKKALPWTP